MLAASVPLPAAAGFWRPDSRDACAIGTVTRERYLEIARQAERLPQVPWRAVLVAARSGPNGPLTAHLRRAVEVGTTPDERLAAVHAALRRAGAAYTWASASPGRTPGAVLPRTITYRYVMDTWDMGLWRPLCRRSTVVVHLILDAASCGRARSRSRGGHRAELFQELW